MCNYKEQIEALLDSFIKNSELNINKDIVIEGRVPTSVSSEFITNKEQGDWAENLVFQVINSSNSNYIAVHYGKDDDISAGDPGFKEFYEKYQDELNTIGKRPDILIFKRQDIQKNDVITEEQVSKAVGALEVRSSSFLLKKYDNFMLDRTNKSLNIIKDEILKIKSNSQLDELLRNKDKVIYDFIHNATIENIESLSFRQRSWSSTPALRELTEHLKIIKENIKIVQKRDYLSITPKLEDIALVNRWIQKYNVPHFYLQVFFDCAYIISFADILKIASDPNKEGHEFTIEKDIKNQGKTTIKINIRYTDLIIDQIKMPNHYSAMKELDRGRLLFFVKFKGGEGCLELDAFNKILGLNK